MVSKGEPLVEIQEAKPPGGVLGRSPALQARMSRPVSRMRILECPPTTIA